MTYELAKALKDAGYPQNKDIGFYYVDGEEYLACQGSGYECDCFCTFDVNNAYSKRVVSIPTLSELIKACGPHFYGINRASDGTGWVATRGWLDNNDDVGGLTPEEAVANLWLELNK